VTARRWAENEAWARARQAEGAWRSVRAYDADDIETWLESAPAVHGWISRQLGKHPDGIVDVETFWADWSQTTRPALTPEFVLSGREEILEKLHEWFRGPSESIAIKAESRDEAVAVAAAAMLKLPSAEQISFLSRTLILSTQPACDQIASFREPLILISAIDGNNAYGRAVRAPHRVIVPLGADSAESLASLNVPRLSGDGAAKALIVAGVGESRARELAVLARRSLKAFRRKLALRPEVQRPVWARSNEAGTLTPALLAGTWSDRNAQDRQVVSALARTPYEEFQSNLVRWSKESDPPVRYLGDAWYLASKEDAWSLLAGYLTRDDLERFKGEVLKVLGTPDSRFDLPDHERWMARVLDRAPRYSNHLAQGLADTLAIMGARGAAIVIGGTSAELYAAHIVNRLLYGANSDWRAWASLSAVLPLVAEAAPDAFLEAVEKGLSGDQPIMKLFTDTTDNLFSSSPHTGLLWALETLAWDPARLGRVTLELAKLSRLDAGGRLSNRPQKSLTEIFAPWHAQTSASPEQGFRVIDMLSKREPEVTWRLLHELLSHDVATNTSRPRWREWTPDKPVVITRRELYQSVRGIISRLLHSLAKVESAGTMSFSCCRQCPQINMKQQLIALPQWISMVLSLRSSNSSGVRSAV